MTDKVDRIYLANIDSTLEERIELPKEFRREWLKFLRSGEFGQTQSELTDGDGNYCCLGVACKAAGYSDYFLRQVSTRTGTAKTESGDLLGFAGYIHEGGFNLKKVPSILHGDQEFPDRLADFNDDGYSFEDIADFIERNTVGV